MPFSTVAWAWMANFRWTISASPVRVAKAGGIPAPTVRAGSDQVELGLGRGPPDRAGSAPEAAAPVEDLEAAVPEVEAPDREAVVQAALEAVDRAANAERTSGLLGRDGQEFAAIVRLAERGSSFTAIEPALPKEEID